MTDNRALASRRILVVEDQYYLATDICGWLEDAGAIVVGPAPDAAHACDLLEQQEVDTAVVDINLGLGPTFSVARELTERRVPFLFATGYDLKAIPEEFRDKVRLEKPFNGAALVAALRDLSGGERP